MVCHTLGNSAFFYTLITQKRIQKTQITQIKFTEDGLSDEIKAFQIRCSGRHWFAKEQSIMPEADPLQAETLSLQF